MEVTHQKVQVLIATLTIVAASVTVGYRWVTASTPVSVAEAIRRSELHQRISATPRAPHVQTKVPRPSSPPRPTPSPSRSPGAHQPVLRPHPGVYTWQTDGYEEALGIGRRFPSESQRIVTIPNQQGYDYHHFYSQEHQQWFEGRSGDDRILVPYVRERVAFGPFDAEIEVLFRPAIAFLELPLAVDRTWEGAWSGETFGTYSGRIFERTTMRVGSSNVDAWGIHVSIEMHGEVDGRQDIRAWIAPAEQTTVREEYVVTGRLRGEPGTYHGEWTIVLSSLKPQQI